MSGCIICFVVDTPESHGITDPREARAAVYVAGLTAGILLHRFPVHQLCKEHLLDILCSLDALTREGRSADHPVILQLASDVVERSKAFQ